MSVRRVVTTHDKNGKATVWADGPAENVKRPNDFIISTLLWSTTETPADFMEEFDGGSRILGTTPPTNGSRFIMFEVLPGGRGKFHHTDSLDYVISVEGELVLLFDESEVILKPGDVVIQRGTNHGWENRGSVSARVAIVLIDGKPKRESSVAGADSAK
jgi:quercetin dioxygenase-like cupin family protein